jgi:hypothetical protein
VKRETFNHIVFARHSDDALHILDASRGATPTEREILNAFCWNRNEDWLHFDENVGPKFILGTKNEKWVGLPTYAAFAPCVVLLELYRADNCRRAMHEEGKRPSGILVSLVLSANSVRGQRLLARLDSGRHRAFTGASTRYGFHEGWLCLWPVRGGGGSWSCTAVFD